MFKSLEKRASNLPFGVESKNNIGHLRTLDNIMLCKHFEALSPAYDTVNAAIYVVITICDLKIV